MKKAAIILLCIVSVACRGFVPISREYLIPKDYLGYVIILYGQEDGMTLRVSWGTASYDVPKDGVIRIRDSYPDAIRWRRNRYFYLDSGGRKEELARRAKGTEFGVFGETIGTVVVSVHGHLTAVAYEGFVVGHPASQQRWESIEEVVRRVGTRY